MSFDRKKSQKINKIVQVCSMLIKQTKIAHVFDKREGSKKHDEDLIDDGRPEGRRFLRVIKYKSCGIYDMGMFIRKLPSLISKPKKIRR